MKLFLAKITRFLSLNLVFIILICASIPVARATDYSSTDFIVRDPVISTSGGYASSSSFQTYVSEGQTIIGENSSLSFIQRAGFLYFAVATAPVVTPTAGDVSVTLNWTASTAYLGASVASYAVGQSATAGGPYVFTDVGLVLSSVRNGLTNGTPYYFIIEARDADGQNLVRSGEVTATPVAGQNQAPGGGSVSANAATISGRTGSGQVITFLNGSQVAGTTTADSNGNFTKNLSGLTGGQYTFSIYGTDSAKRRTSLYSVPVTVPDGSTATVNGIILSPTLSASASEIKKGETLVFSGQAVPNSLVEFTLTPGLSSASVIAGADGKYNYSLDTTNIPLGSYLARTLARLSPQVFSNLSFPLPFIVGNRTIKAPTVPIACGDFNSDIRVNLVDFSILVFWFNKSDPPARIDCNSDNRIDLVDFSILMYYWTG
jgi:hypothetical protein